MRHYQNKWAEEHHVSNILHPLPLVQKPKNLHIPPRKTLAAQEADDLDITEKGAYVVEWASLAKDLTALFLEGAGLVILGHFVTVAAIMMLVGLLMGVYSLRRRSRKRRK